MKSPAVLVWHLAVVASLAAAPPPSLHAGARTDAKMRPIVSSTGSFPDLLNPGVDPRACTFHPSSEPPAGESYDANHLSRYLLGVLGSDPSALLARIREASDEKPRAGRSLLDGPFVKKLINGHFAERMAKLKEQHAAAVRKSSSARPGTMPDSDQRLSMIRFQLLGFPSISSYRRAFRHAQSETAEKLELARNKLRELRENGADPAEIVKADAEVTEAQEAADDAIDALADADAEIYSLVESPILRKRAVQAFPELGPWLKQNGAELDAILKAESESYAQMMLRSGEAALERNARSLLEDRLQGASILRLIQSRPEIKLVIEVSVEHGQRGEITSVQPTSAHLVRFTRNSISLGQAGQPLVVLSGKESPRVEKQLNKAYGPFEELRFLKCPVPVFDEARKSKALRAGLKRAGFPERANP